MFFQTLGREVEVVDPSQHPLADSYDRLLSQLLAIRLAGLSAGNRFDPAGIVDQPHTEVWALLQSCGSKFKSERLNRSEVVTTHLWIPPCQVAFDRMRTCDRMRTFIRPQRCGDLMTAGRYGDACPETGPNQVQELTAR